MQDDIMKHPRAGQSTEPFLLEVSSGNGQEAADDFADDERGGRPDGLQQQPIDLRGVRLFRIASPEAGAAAEWQAEMTLHGEVQRLRFASELRARAWLAVGDNPRYLLSGF